MKTEKAKQHLYFKQDDQWVLRFLRELAEFKKTTVSQEVLDILKSHLLKLKYDCEAAKQVIENYPTKDTKVVE